MGSGVLQAPLIDLVVTTPESAVSAMRVRGGRSHRSAAGPLTQPHVVIVGSPHSGKTSLVNALVNQPGAAPVEGSTGGAWLVFRHGPRLDARAFVPGHREPRPVLLDGLRVVEAPAAGRGAPGRPPRRIEISHPAALLQRLALVDTSGVGGLDAANAEIILDAAERGAGLLFVTTAATPLTRAELDLLAAAVGRVRRIAFVLTHIDEHDDWPEVLAANRALLTSHGPQISRALWFPVSLERSGAFGVAELQHLLDATWSVDLPVVGPSIGGVTAATVSSGDNAWQTLLEQEIRARRLAAVQQVSIDLATTHVRCVKELGSGKGCPELPHVLDRELHALSVRTSRQLAADTAAIIHSVFGRLLDQPPNESVLARITKEARRTVDVVGGDTHERDRALLLTATSAVAAVTGAAAVDSLSAVGSADPSDRVLPALGVGLNASCYFMWQPKSAPGGSAKSADKKDCRRWLQHALREVEVEVDVELNQRYGDLQQALAIIAADAVDHGVLLA